MDRSLVRQKQLYEHFDRHRASHNRHHSHLHGSADHGRHHQPKRVQIEGFFPPINLISFLWLSRDVNIVKRKCV